MVQTKKFQKIVLDYYKIHGRHTLPWRQTKNPYKILISEIMLQQTQVDRVIPKYRLFLKKFSTVSSLARATKSEVLETWSGLGYNRRALFLKRTAEIIVADKKSIFPSDVKELELLPGVGPYTARAVSTFAYNVKNVFIETNIRTVFIHHFFHPDDRVSDKEILTLVEQTLPKRANEIRDWYYALMDYGVFLKKTIGNKNKQSLTYSTQKSFKTSNRFIRGALLKMLTKEKTVEIKYFLREYVSDIFPKEKIEKIIQDLEEEGLIVIKHRTVYLP